jgi:hypothetical protein
MKKEEMIKAPKKRFGLPCYDKSTCDVNFCKEVDTIAEGYETTATIMLRRKPRKEIRRQPCNKECKRRVNLNQVPIHICVKAKCEFFSQEGCYCKKYVEENKRRHKPPPFKFSKGLTTPTDQGFFGQKRLAR